MVATSDDVSVISGLQATEFVPPTRPGFSTFRPATPPQGPPKGEGNAGAARVELRRAGYALRAICKIRRVPTRTSRSVRCRLEELA